MKTFVRHLTGVCIALLVAPAWAAGQESAVDSLVTEWMQEQGVPGLAAAFIDDGALVWSGVYGGADIEQRRAVTADTPFQIASISKPITAVVLLSLHAQGRFGLDDDVNAYLPFPVRNPNHPGTPITFRQLLRHRSSLRDNNEVYGKDDWNKGIGDPTTELESFYRSYFEPGGARYFPGNFEQYAPGRENRYCNSCFALLGLLAQRIAGRPFEQLSREVLFEPLGMRDTAWSLARLAALRTVPPAIPYHTRPDSVPVAHGHNGYPDWPAGLVRASIRDMSRFLVAYLNDGEYMGESVIDPGTIDILSPLDAQVGFHVWFQAGMSDGSVWYLHTGSDPGVRTVLAFDRARRQGVIILMNGEAGTREFTFDLLAAVRAAAAGGR